MKRILIPTDFSKLADYAYNLAHRLFENQEIEIHVLSIITLTPDILFDETGEFRDDGSLDMSALDVMKAEMEDSMKLWVESKPDLAQSRVKLGDLCKDVIKYIGDYGIDMVIMGTSGASGLKEVFNGSHTSYLSMRCPVPVLSVKSDQSDNTFRNIVLAGDFRNPQMVDLSVVKELLPMKSSKLHLLKVNTPGDFETNESVEARMNEFAEINELGQVDCHVYCDYNVEKGIDTFSREKGMDIIAIGTQQRTGISRIVRRSVSYDVINHVKKAIISFPMN